MGSSPLWQWIYRGQLDVTAQPHKDCEGNFIVDDIYPASRWDGLVGFVESLARMEKNQPIFLPPQALTEGFRILKNLGAKVRIAYSLDGSRGVLSGRVTQVRPPNENEAHGDIASMIELDPGQKFAIWDNLKISNYQIFVDELNAQIPQGESWESFRFAIENLHPNLASAIDRMAQGGAIRGSDFAAGSRAAEVRALLEFLRWTRVSIEFKIGSGQPMFGEMIDFQFVGGQDSRPQDARMTLNLLGSRGLNDEVCREEAGKFLMPRPPSESRARLDYDQLRQRCLESIGFRLVDLERFYIRLH